MFRNLMPILTLLAIVVMAPDAGAAGSAKTYDVGVLDLKFSTGFDGLVSDYQKKNLFSDVVLKYGVADRFSAYVAASLLSDQFSEDTRGRGSMGLVATPVNRDRLNVGLGFDVTFDSSRLSMAPKLQFDFNLGHDSGKLGLYFKLEESIFVAGDAVGNISSSRAGGALQFVRETGLTVGTSWALVKGHQLQIEYAMDFGAGHSLEPEAAEIAGISIGYNVKLSDYIKNFYNISVDIPGAGGELNAGLKVGFVLKIPGF